MYVCMYVCIYLFIIDSCRKPIFCPRQKNEISSFYTFPVGSAIVMLERAISVNSNNNNINNTVVISLQTGRCLQISISLI
jgi:hypothetical protein